MENAISWGLTRGRPVSIGAGLVGLVFLVGLLGSGCSDSGTAGGPGSLSPVPSTEGTPTDAPGSTSGERVSDPSEVSPSGTSGTPSATSRVEPSSTSGTSSEGCPEDEVGQPCGACGFLVCVEGELVCEDPGTNACGGCGTLVTEPQTPCGCDEGGEWTCNDDGSQVFCSDPQSNACGGCAELEAPPGSACTQECGSGTWTCADYFEIVICVVDEEGVETNVCGGCDPLDGAPGDACEGACGPGQLRCDRDGSLECSGPGENACGGCGELPETLGDTCSLGCDEGVFVCDPETPGAVICDAPAPNSCGGCEPEPEDFDPGAACGCGGTWQCRPAGSTLEPQCIGGDEVNACGGCGILGGTPGEPCLDGANPCAVLACNEDGSALFCDAETPEVNACGGCAVLPVTAVEGEACGCGAIAEWSCTNPDLIECVFSFENACGGCDPLAGQPGTSCGTGDCGVRVCQGGDVICVDDDVNVCGGCGSLAGRIPGTVCEPPGGGCGQWVCDGAGDTTCQPALPNACGGCATLEAAPFTACGACGAEWVCAQDQESVFCDRSAQNACGGCTELQGEPGLPCGPGGCGAWECVADGEAVFCRDDIVNTCGGCTDLGDLIEGEQCDICPQDVYVCTSEEDIVCEQGLRNACGGCTPFPEGEVLGEPCPCGDDWVCAADNESLECPRQNACGGCEFLPPGVLGTACTPPGGGCGRVVCDGENATRCEALPGNECGGCIGFAEGRAPGDACACGEYVCDGPNATVCAGANACGGCDVIDESLLGTTCGEGDCGRFLCTGENTIECVDPGTNECGGCQTFLASRRPGEPCECGVFVCDPGNPNRTVCEGGNPCGGCEPIPSQSLIGDTCDAPGSQCGRFVCTGSDDFACLPTEPNGCGGCDVLDSNLGGPCGPENCGVIVCDGLNGTTCNLAPCDDRDPEVSGLPDFP